ncbi:hypothetical protein [Pleionea sediminis]|uniref:hypothetical protein n=1 Tax=Pleionea sediminis TaxID=2569479 RepID=UPI0013DE2AF2|nr:hypothetical protein [Pleionea sediminis]
MGIIVVLIGVLIWYPSFFNLALSILGMALLLKYAFKVLKVNSTGIAAQESLNNL